MDIIQRGKAKIRRLTKQQQRLVEAGEAPPLEIMYDPAIHEIDPRYESLVIEEPTPVNEIPRKGAGMQIMHGLYAIGRGVR